MAEIVGVQDKTQIGSLTLSDGSSVTYDGLQKTNFTLFFPKLPQIMFAMQSFELPSISVHEVEQSTRFADVNQIGEKLNYEPYTVTFIVDKYMRNYISAFHWMKAMTVEGSNVGLTDDAILFINGKPTLKFVDAWVTELGRIELDSTDANGELVICSLTLNYDYIDYVGEFATTDSTY